ncbi:branched-chain amino acid transport system ATP-binding protein [Zymobacter palmae]|uniref:Branched-chain amino acid transport system ATP-binding protein n=2 Tax=Zymobacter palmae TaxID=33074 RepID=A0A348HDZ5_9GAMM|nr:branched-chain amino acid transport system ATP-binding protein [Zymobacter palmae]
MGDFLTLQHVSRTFGGLKAVDDVSLTLRQGELVGLIGPNGAGKTTLFNLITGFTRPSNGSIRWQGRDIQQLSAHRIAHLGIVRTFQNLKILPNMTVFDNVSVGAMGQHRYRLWDALVRRGKPQRAVAESTWRALEVTGLADAADQLAANLSYGQRKYLEIARALALSPQLLILDEPAAGLNDTETAQLADFLATLHRSGITLLLVEHDLNLVRTLCQRVLVLASGALVAQGTPDDIWRNPLVQDIYLGRDDEEVTNAA